nr:MAG TPA: hypothetical protein [Caudoviricetes sp.]
MRNFYTITEEEFETAARFLQVTSLMGERTDTRYDNETSVVSYETHGVGCVERRKQLREWLDSQIPRCTSWTANTYRGTTVQWDGVSLTLHRRGKVLAEFSPSELQKKPYFHGNWQHVPGASIKDDGTFKGRYDLRELTCVGTLGRVLSLLEDEDSYCYDITRARKIVSRTLQDAGICVEFDTQGDAFDDSLIVWGYYGVPIEAIERQEALENRRVTALSVPVLRSWFHKPKPKKEEIAKPEKTEPEKTEPETEPESERRIRWDWGLVMVELLILGGIAYIWSTQGSDHPALVPLCSLGVLVAISGLSVLAALEWEDSDE